MSVVNELQELSSAEEFFEYLGVSYEPEVLGIARLHVMRLLGELVGNVEVADGESDESVKDRFARCLKRAYAELEDEGPLKKRLFKVHKKAASTEMAFLPLSELTVLPMAWSKPESCLASE